MKDLESQQTKRPLGLSCFYRSLLLIPSSSFFCKGLLYSRVGLDFLMLTYSKTPTIIIYKVYVQGLSVCCKIGEREGPYTLPSLKDKY